MRYLVLFALCLPVFAQPKGRVFVISLDGLGHQAFTQDPAASELRTLRALAASGVQGPLQAAFPSLTAPGHAALFTGAYGNVNGITANDIPTGLDQRVNGFRAEQLRSEMFWLKAARAGVKVVAANPTQGYPCNEFNSGPGVALFNGYQTAETAPAKLLRGKDVQWLDAAPLGFVPPKKSRRPMRYFEYSSGRVRFTGVVFARGPGYDTVRMTAYSGKRYVDAELHEAETTPPGHGTKARPLARYFSEALPVADITAVHFRLFELGGDGQSFLLMQSQGKEISLCVDGDAQAAKFKEKLIASAGAFVGNGAGNWYRTDALGKRHTDGLAERRLLETFELHARQTMRHTRALDAEFSPRLLIDYLSTADDMQHAWWGLAAGGDAFLDRYRRWGFQIVDWRIGELKQMLRPGDSIVAVSDHGMGAVSKELRVNSLLRELGYRDRVAAQDHFLITEPRNNRALLEEVRGKLALFRDNGAAVFGEWFWPDQAGAKFGIGGLAGGHLYFDLAPGYKAVSDEKKGPITVLAEPHGEHGPLPTRPELLALFVANGPRVKERALPLRSVDVASVLLFILGE